MAMPTWKREVDETMNVPGGMFDDLQWDYEGKPKSVNDLLGNTDFALPIDETGEFDEVPSGGLHRKSIPHPQMIPSQLDADPQFYDQVVPTYHPDEFDYYNTASHPPGPAMGNITGMNGSMNGSMNGNMHGNMHGMSQMDPLAHMDPMAGMGGNLGGGSLGGDMGGLNDMNGMGNVGGGMTSDFQDPYYQQWNPNWAHFPEVDPFYEQEMPELDGLYADYPRPSQSAASAAAAAAVQQPVYPGMAQHPHANRHPQANQHPHAQARAPQHARPHASMQARGPPHQHAHPNAQAHAQAHAQAQAQAHAHAQAQAQARAHAHAQAQAQAHAQAQAQTQAQAHAPVNPLRPHPHAMMPAAGPSSMPVAGPSRAPVPVYAQQVHHPAVAREHGLPQDGPMGPMQAFFKGVPFDVELYKEQEAAASAPRKETKLARSAEADKNDVSLLKVDTCPDDRRKFKLCMLPNGMEVLIVHEPLSKGTVALSVAAGSLDDPPEFPGLAQFVQRMITCGSKRFPGTRMHREYFVSKNESSAGALTMGDITVHTIQVVNQFMRAGIERLMRSITEPLFPPEAVNDELNAMDELFANYAESDEGKYEHLENMLSGCTFTRFGTRASLLGKHPQGTTPDKHQKLVRAAIAFYHKHYVPSKMKLLIYASQKTDLVEKWIEFLFVNLNEVMNGQTMLPSSINVPEQTFEQPPKAFEHPFTGTLVRVVAQPAKPGPRLIVTFPVADQRMLYNENPIAYFGYVLNLDEPQSFLGRMKTMGLVSALECTYDHKMDGIDLFKIDMTLTENGNLLWDRVAGFLFVYLEDLTAQPPQVELYERMVEDMRASLAERKMSAYDEAVASVELMQLPIPRERLLTFHIPREFNARMIHTAGGCLRFNNAMISHLTPDAPWDRQEPSMGIKYSMQQMSFERVKNAGRIVPT